VCQSARPPTEAPSDRETHSGSAHARFAAVGAELRPRPHHPDGRKGVHVHKLIAKYGRKGNMMVWKEQLNGDCPNREGRLDDRCDLVCPDPSKVL
jgi:hypothetical protein